MIRARVLKDGSRIMWCEWRPGMGNCKPTPTFDQAKANAVQAMDKLGLTPDVLLRMQRRLDRGQRYKLGEA